MRDLHCDWVVSRGTSGTSRAAYCHAMTTRSSSSGFRTGKRPPLYNAVFSFVPFPKLVQETYHIDGEMIVGLNFFRYEPVAHGPLDWRSCREQRDGWS
jgi:hypothetical protein